jgi:hypothetical protein
MIFCLTNSWSIDLINFPYSNKGDRLLGIYIAQGINKEISSSLKQEIKVSIIDENVLFTKLGLKGFFQRIGTTSLQQILLTSKHLYKDLSSRKENK